MNNSETFEQFVERWSGYALDTAPAPREEAERNYAAMYALIGLPAPAVVWGASPLALSLAGAAIARYPYADRQAVQNAIAAAIPNATLASAVTELALAARDGLGGRGPGVAVKPRITPLWRDADDGLSPTQKLRALMEMDRLNAAFSSLFERSIHAVSPLVRETITSFPRQQRVALGDLRYTEWYLSQAGQLWQSALDSVVYTAHYGQWNAISFARYEWPDSLLACPTPPLVEECKLAGWSIGFENIVLAGDRAARFAFDGDHTRVEWRDGVTVDALPDKTYQVVC